MTIHRRFIALAATSLALTAGLPAVAQQEGPEAIKALVTPQKEMGGGVAGVMDDGRFFGMYSGMNESDPYVLFDMDVNYRNNETGTWYRLNGRNLGLDSRDVRFEHERQGSWKYFIDFSQLTKSNPFKIETGLTGMGTNVQAVNGTTRRFVDLETERQQAKLGFRKLLGEKFDVNLSYRVEEKDGDRQWGTQGFNFVTEPIDAVTQEIVGTVDYKDRKLQMSAGYLGSFYRNNYNALSSDAGESPVALPPDNQAHQLYVSGGYTLTPTARVNFKTSYTMALQDENYFTAPTFAGNNQSSLDGRVDTFLAQIGLSARPLPKLSVVAKVRYEDRKDKTPEYQYLSADSERSGFNVPLSRTTTTGKVDATYQLPMGFRLLGGVEYEQWSRNEPDIRQVSFRPRTEEISLRIGARRMLMENLGGKLEFVHSDRTGSDYHNGLTARVGPIHWSNRDRNKAKLTLDWTPIDPLSVQLLAEGSRDDYDGRELGARNGSAHMVSLDALYRFSDKWNLTAWASWNEIDILQKTNGDGTGITDKDWTADQSYTNKAVGMGLRGKLSDNIKIGANAEYDHNRSEHEMVVLDGSTVSQLPDILYRQASLTAFADYSFFKNSRIRLKYGYYRISADDWTWQSTSIFDDNTTITIPDREETHFIGVSYHYKW